METKSRPFAVGDDCVNARGQRVKIIFDEGGDNYPLIGVGPDFELAWYGRDGLADEIDRANLIGLYYAVSKELVLVKVDRLITGEMPGAVLYTNPGWIVFTGDISTLPCGTEIKRVREVIE